MTGLSSAAYTAPVATVAAILGTPLRAALCLECLTTATGLRVSEIALELDRLATTVVVRKADCEHCHVTGPVFRMAAS